MTGFFGRLAPNLFADRKSPPLPALAAETDAERFVWSVLPHAARTFGLAVALLPARLARPLAAAYLWCRALDTVEDLAPDAASRITGFAACASAAERGTPFAPPTGAVVQDVRDRVHLLLIDRAPLLVRFTETLDGSSRARIVSLVRVMAAGMDAAARTREATGGVLDQGPGREAYCRAVLAEPLWFAECELRAQGGDPAADADRRALTDAAGELIQLANVCRDVEKDLERGVAYDARLAPYLQSRVAPPEVAAEARRGVLRRVGVLQPSVEPYFAGLPLAGRPGARAAAAVMCAATASFFQRANRKLPRPVLRDLGAEGSIGVAGAVMRAALSKSGAEGVFARLAPAFELAPLAEGSRPIGCPA